SAIMPVSTNYGNAVNLQIRIPAKEGCDFTGWFKDPECTKPAGSSIQMTVDATLYAGWKTREYSVDFRTNGGSEQPSLCLEHGSVLDLKNHQPVKKGYVFTGWYTDPECTKKAEVQTAVKSDLTLYAGWKLEEHALTFCSNDGSEPKTVTFDYGSMFDLNNYVLEREGFVFKGWYTDPECRNQASGQITLYSDTTLYAGWEAIAARLIFVSDGGSRIPAIKAEYGTVVNLEDYASTKDGCVFLGWYTDIDYTHKAEGQITLTGDTVLYARWKIRRQILRFETNGGSEIDAVRADWGTTVHLEEYLPAKDGYAFTGWYTDEECTKKADSQITLKSDTTLYAGWKTADTADVKPQSKS
ncbi:MAG: InlB B-repeat-containing protein, partial [Erysipelotrichaceae bacterium]|nr:InlB B-repeat-containing protein [Erysipelotrichaceae bacterium]